jgi:hypothetical protein
MKTLISVLNSTGHRVQDMLIAENSAVAVTVEGYPGGATVQIGPYDEKAPPPNYVSWVGLSVEITVNDSPHCPAMRFVHANLFEFFGEVQTLKLVFSPAPQKNPDQ